MGENKHGRIFIRRQMEESCEDKQAHSFIAAYLSRRSGENKEQIIDGVAKDRCARRDGQANRPEGEHGEETIAGNSQAGERHSWQEDMGTAGASKQRVNKASSKRLHLPANASGE